MNQRMGETEVRVAGPGVPLPVTPAAEPPALSDEAKCCPPLQCRYRPSAIRRILAWRAALVEEGFDPTEGLRSCLSPGKGYEMGRSNTGPSNTIDSAAEICADLEWARAAGCVDPLAISRFLCPFGELDDEMAQAVDDDDEMAVHCG